MNKLLTKILACFAVISCSVEANEMFSVDPTSYVISGKDRYNEDAYSISMGLKRTNKKTLVEKLFITIYDQSIKVGGDILNQVEDPDLLSINAVNDAGLFGSYFYIDIPFGKRRRCKEARKYKLKKSIYISNLGRMDGKGLKAEINDPCQKL